MEDMSALEYPEESSIYLRAADGTFPSLRFGFFRLFSALVFLFLHKLLKRNLVLLILLVYPLFFLPFIDDEMVVGHKFFQVVGDCA
jgi:hypothetical protein